MKVYVDGHRHSYLVFRETGKAFQAVSMVKGQIEIISLTRKEFGELIEHPECTPKHFAEVYLKSTQEISRAARAILRGLLGRSEELSAPAAAPRFSGAVVALPEICAVYNWNPSHVRRHLRKLMDRPSGRWVFTPEEAERVVQMVKECLLQENTSSEQ